MTDPSAWLLVDFVCDRDSADLVGAELWARGVAAVEEIDNDDGTVTLRTSMGEASGGAAAEIVATLPGVTAVPVEIPRSVADTWRRFVGPSHVMDDVWLVPEWCEEPTGRCVRVEPFDTFGLGNHPTTVLALRLALPCCGPGKQVMDLGSGSGVLSVALALLTGAHADAHDIAPQGASALEHNARLNNVTELVRWRGALSAVDNGRYEVLVANILAPVLRELAGDIMTAVRAGGLIILSGMRTEQVESVLGCYPGCAAVSRADEDGWTAVALRRA